jgi:hypothetical protein
MQSSGVVKMKHWCNCDSQKKNKISQNFQHSTLQCEEVKTTVKDRFTGMAADFYDAGIHKLVTR